MITLSQKVANDPSLVNRIPEWRLRQPLQVDSMQRITNENCIEPFVQRPSAIMQRLQSALPPATATTPVAPPTVQPLLQGRDKGGFSVLDWLRGRYASGSVKRRR